MILIKNQLYLIFFRTTVHCPHLDGYSVIKSYFYLMYLFSFSKHVVFGRVVQGKVVVDFIENQERMRRIVLIANCGELVLVKKSAKQPKLKANESDSEESDDSSSSSSEDERKKRKRKRKEKKNEEEEV